MKASPIDVSASNASLLQEEKSEKENFFKKGIFDLKPTVYILLPACILSCVALLGFAPLLPTLQLRWFSGCADVVPKNHTPSSIVSASLLDDATDIFNGCKPDYGRTQLWSGILSALQNTIAFFMAPIAGQFADRMGRKPLMVLAAACTALPTLALILTNLGSPVAYYGMNFLIGLTGVSAGYGVLGYFNMYVSDCTPEESRSRALSFIGATFGVSTVLTPALGSVKELLGGELNYLKFLLVVSLVNFIYVLLVIPESMNLRKPKAGNKAFGINPLKPLKMTLNSEVLFWICVVCLLVSLPAAGTAQIGLLYLNQVYNLSPLEAEQFDALVMSAMGAAQILGQLVFLQIFLHFRWSNWSILCVSQIFSAVHLLWYTTLSFMPMWWYFINCIPIGMSMISSVPMVKLVSISVNKNEYGVALGSISSIQSLGGIFGPLLFSQLYSRLENTRFSLLPMFLGAVLTSTAAFLSFYKLRAAEKSLGDRTESTEPLLGPKGNQNDIEA